MAISDAEPIQRAVLATCESVACQLTLFKGLGHEGFMLFVGLDCVKLLHTCSISVHSLTFWMGCNRSSAWKLTDKTYNLYSHFIQMQITNSSSSKGQRVCVLWSLQNACCAARQLPAFSYGFTRNFSIAPFNLCSLLLWQKRKIQGRSYYRNLC